MTNLEAVIKVGGSIVRNRKKLIRLCRYLDNLRNEHSFVVIAGGGRIAGDVRELYSEYRLSEKSAHLMAVKAMDINSFVIQDVSSRMQVTDSLKETRAMLSRGIIPVLLTSKIMESNTVLPASWDVTSDSIAAYAAARLKTKTVILVKHCAGIARTGTGKISEHITAAELDALSAVNDCTDRHLPRLIERYDLRAWVLSVDVPGRIGKVLAGGTPRGTLITRKNDTQYL